MGIEMAGSSACVFLCLFIKLHLEQTTFAALFALGLSTLSAADTKNILMLAAFG